MTQALGTMADALAGASEAGGRRIASERATQAARRASEALATRSGELVFDAATLDAVALDAEEASDVVATLRRSERLLWLAKLSALLASFLHLASAFALFETGSQLVALFGLGASAGLVVAIASAVAIDVGLWALTSARAALARAGVEKSLAARGVWLFAVVSAFANAYAYALTASATGRSDLLARAVENEVAVVLSVLAFAASLPALIVFDSACLRELGSARLLVARRASLLAGDSQAQGEPARVEKSASARAASTTKRAKPAKRTTKRRSAQSAPDIRERVVEAIEQAPSASNRALARLGDVSEASIRRHIASMLDEGELASDDRQAGGELRFAA